MGRPEVKHISTEAWVDFARGLPPPQKADQMKHHLEGCKKCRKAYDMWRAVAGAVSRGKEISSQRNCSAAGERDVRLT